MGRNAQIRRQKKMMDQTEVPQPQGAPQAQVLGVVQIMLVQNPDGTVGVATQHNFDNQIIALGVIEAGKVALQAPAAAAAPQSRLVVARGNVPRG